MNEEIKGYFLGNMDIEFYLSTSKLDSLKENSEGISGTLKDVHNLGVSRKFTLRYGEWPSAGDGIKVDILPDKDDFKYDIKIDQRAIDEIKRNGIWGSRQRGGAGIRFSTKQLPWEKVPKH